MSDMTSDQAVTTATTAISQAVELFRERRGKIGINTVSERIAIDAVIAQLDAAQSAVFFLARQTHGWTIDSDTQRRIRDDVRGTGHAHTFRKLLPNSDAMLDAIIDCAITATVRHYRGVGSTG